MKIKKIIGLSAISLCIIVLIIFVIQGVHNTNINNNTDINKSGNEFQRSKEFQSETAGPKQQNTDANTSKTNYKNALIIFTFDDGNQSDYTLAYPILKKYGINGTSYINANNADHHVKHKLSWDEIKKMYAAGWDFEDHTYSHINLTKSAPEQIRESLEKTNEAFIRNGLKIPEAFAYPYGKFDQKSIDIIKKYRKQARLAFYTDNFVDLRKTDPYQITSVSADMQTEKRLKGKEKLVDKACLEKAIIVFRVHCIYRNKLNDMGNEVVQTNSKVFAKLVDYCVKKDCSFTTMDGLIKMSSNI